VRFQKITKRTHNKIGFFSPTVSPEAMKMSCIIDAKENRYVVVTDIPGALLHADMEDEVHMLLTNCQIRSKTIHKYIWSNKKDKSMLYVRLKKALVGTLQAALLFWRLLSDTLKGWGFKLNEYDKSVANQNHQLATIHYYLTCG
jgi:hypothetical protein